MSESLGPLERVDSRWALGDARRPGRAWVEFRTDGLHAVARDSRVEIVPWSRIMLGFRITLGGRYPNRDVYTQMGVLGGLPGPFKGRGGGYLHMTVRHPYEDQQLFFDRHPRWYRTKDVLTLQAVMTQLVEDGEVHRLGDADWTARVVDCLATFGGWATTGALRRAAAEAVEAAGPPSPGAGQS
ncbi:hypothetical protein [Streptomyces sp. NPDC001401]|uniref:hypothetical protein n=1 Tax=Streptomyces sp. NPDC001401 TaxID=3364570 RepID=UPI0036C0AB55